MLPGSAALVAGPEFVVFELGGVPIAKGRHRARMIIPKHAWSYSRVIGKYLTEEGARKIFMSEYPDPKSAKYEAIIREAAGLFMRGRAPSVRPIALLVHSFRPLLKGFSRADRERALVGAIRPATRPDWDNYGKITDALNEVVWQDDGQVVDARVIKEYSDRPALRIEVREFVDPVDAVAEPR